VSSSINIIFKDEIKYNKCAEEVGKEVVLRLQLIIHVFRRTHTHAHAHTLTHAHAHTYRHTHAHTEREKG
jgi:hypothetical protein